MSNTERRPLFEQSSPYTIDCEGRVYRDGAALAPIAWREANNRLHSALQRDGVWSRPEPETLPPETGRRLVDGKWVEFTLPGRTVPLAPEPALKAVGLNGEPLAVCYRFVLIPRADADAIRADGRAMVPPIRPNAFVHPQHYPLVGDGSRGWHWLDPGPAKYLFHGPSIAKSIFAT